VEEWADEDCTDADFSDEGFADAPADAPVGTTMFDAPGFAVDLPVAIVSAIFFRFWKTTTSVEVLVMAEDIWERTWNSNHPAYVKIKPIAPVNELERWRS
jgi:hypothetical protein